MFENQQLGQVKYIKVVQGQNRYLIEDFNNLSGCYVFATKKKTEALMEEISSDHYSFESFENNNYIRFEDGFPINDYYSFKVIKPEQIISIPYNFNTISSITPDALNSNFEALKESLKKLQNSYNTQIVKIDSDIATVMLPNLDDDEVWVRKGNTYRGFNVGSLEANIKEMLDEIKRIREEILKEMEDNKNKYLAEIKGKFDQEVEQGKANVIATGSQQVELVTQTGNTKIQELEVDFTKKNNTLIETGDSKKQEIIDTYNEKNQAIIEVGEQKKNEVIQTGSSQIELVTAEGDKQVQRVTTQGDIEVQRVIDAGVNGKVNRTGDTMTGDLLIPEHSLQAKNVIASQGIGIGYDNWVNFNNQNQGVGWLLGEHSSTGFLKFLKTDNGVGTYELIHLKPDNSVGIMGITEFTKYINTYSTINARTEGDSRIMSRGFASDYGSSAKSSSGFHVGQDGMPLTVSGTTSTFTKGYQTETITEGIGYTSRYCFGNLTSANHEYAKHQLCAFGDDPANLIHTWTWDMNDGRFTTHRLTVGAESQFNTAIYSSAPSMLISNVTGMHVHSNSGLIGFLNSSGGWIFNVDNGGNMTSVANVTAFSDIKLKKDFEVIPNAIEKIQAISGYTYTRKDSGDRQAGVIAQEIQKVLPEVVKSNVDEKGEETLSVAYGNIVALLIEGIKEQQKQIDELKAKLSEVV